MGLRHTSHRLRPGELAQRGEQGTVTVLAALVMTALVGMLALVIDLGYGFSQRRLAQNAADSAAIAGGKVIAQHIQYGGQSDTRVLQAISEVLAASPGGYGAGFKAYYLFDANQDGTPDSMTTTAVEVGTLGNTAPPTASPSFARGVRVVPQKTSNAFFAGVLGFSSLTRGAQGAAFVWPVVGFRGLVPFAVWAGESRHKCSGSTWTSPLGNGSGKLSGSPPAGVPPPLGTYGCNLTAGGGEVVTYRSPSWQNDNINNGDTNANPNWWDNSSNFKGYFHDSNTNVYIDASIGQTFPFDTQGGVAEGTAQAAEDYIKKCWDLIQAGTHCTLVMPVVDFKTGSGQVNLRISGFAEVVPTNDPSSNTKWTGRVQSQTLDYSAVVGPTCPTTTTCQYAVRLAG